MKLDYDNQRTRGKAAFLEAAEAEEKTPFDIFEELYEKQNNQEMNEEQKKLIHDMIEKIWDGWTLRQTIETICIWTLCKYS